MTYKIEIPNLARVELPGGKKETRILTNNGDFQFFWACGGWNRLFNTEITPTPVTEVQEVRLDQLKPGDVVLCSERMLYDFEHNEKDEYYHLCLFDGIWFIEYTDEEDSVFFTHSLNYEYLYAPIFG